MGPAKYVFVKKYPHHYSFQVYDKDNNPLWRESFKNIPEAQATIPAGMKVDWGECIDLVDFNQVKTEINRKKLEKAMGWDAEDQND